jgi:hypothetical protein
MEYTLTTVDNTAYQMVPLAAGYLQYDVTEEVLTSFDTNDKKSTNVDYADRFVLDAHTPENLLRLTPNTETGNRNKQNWKILLVIKRIDGEKVCIKGALKNTVTNEISLLTAINQAEQNEYTGRLIKTHDNEYKVCHCKMIAPLLFWDELKNRL